MSISWSNTEVQLIVTDYFSMLTAELKGEDYSKAAHRRALLPLLANRSDGSVEFKHQNISVSPAPRLCRGVSCFLVCNSSLFPNNKPFPNPIPYLCH